MTEWRQVLDWKDLYEVSDDGQVRSLHRDPPLILALAEDSDGYYVFSLKGHGRKKLGKVHRLVCQAFHGKSDLMACHLNGNKKDNRAENLYWGTNQQNQLDAVAHGDNFNSSKTVCPLGHSLEHPNLEKWNWENSGKRKCISCSRGKQFVRNRGRRGEQFTEDEVIQIKHRYYERLLDETRASKE